MKKIRIFLLCLLVVLVALSSFLFFVSRHYVVPIMMYHNVEDLDHHEANWVSPDNFEYHMSYLREHDYNVISLKALVDGTLEGKKFPYKTVVVTFDDGLANNYYNAFSVIKRYDIPAIVFVPSDDVDTEDSLTVSQMEEMMLEGVDIGSHTKTQAYLPGLSPENQKKEIFESKTKLEELLDIDIDYFAYPIGGFSESIKGLLKLAGYKAACATNRGFDKSNKDVFELNRIRFSNKDNSDFILMIKLSGYYNFFRKSKNPY